MSDAGPARGAVRGALWAAGWAAGWYLAWDLPRLRAVAAPLSPGGLPSVAVIVPARDEEANLPRLLASLAEQVPTPTEVVVVDDGSTDRTAEVARQAGARVVPAGSRPDGWTGKAWACEVGVRSTSADLLVLLDADVWLAPGALAALVDEHEQRGGLLSVLPHHHTEAAYEQLSAPCNLVSVMGTGAAVPGAEGHADGAFGPCLAVRRSTLAALGGFAAVRGDVVEDLVLARRAADAGLATDALAGGELVAFRMYPNGPAQLVEGWTKNLAAGAGATPRWRAALVGLWVAAGLAGPLAALRRGRRRWLGLLAWLAGTVQFAVLTRRLGRFRWWAAPAHPALLAAFSALVGRSALARRRGVATWRGRQVPLGRASGAVAGPPSARPSRPPRPARPARGLPAALLRLGSLAMRARL